MAQATHAGTFTHERIGVFAGSPASGIAQNFYDIALRDIGLALGALALRRLSHEFDRGAVTTSAAGM